jgi:hypothetical protein
MGRYSYSSKTEADNLKKVEISWLKKYGYLDGWKNGGIEWTHGMGDKSSISIAGSTFHDEPHIQFRYTRTDSAGEKKEFDYKVPLTTTPCWFGGKRYWFICPMSRDGKYCGKRVGVLYMGGDYFACRHCYDLTYNSKNENRGYKYFHLFNTLRVHKKIEELSEQIKRPYYAGQPTKKQRRLDQLYAEAGMSYRAYEGLEKDKML